MPLEIEAKYMVENFDTVKYALNNAEFKCVKPKTLMKRHTYHLSEKQGASPNEWGRVRDEGDKITMTYKHHFDENSALGVEEVELIVDDYNAATQFMEKLGFKDVVTRESYREVWQRGDVEVMLDEWPALGKFVEVEGPSESEVQGISHMLGFDFSKAAFGGVGKLYFQKYNKDISLVKDLTFRNVQAALQILESKTA